MIANLGNIEIPKIAEMLGGDSLDDSFCYSTGDSAGKLLVFPTIDQATLDSVFATYMSTFVDTTLQVSKNQKKFEVDIQAGKTRAKYITTSDGQAEVYLMKAAEAELYVLNGYPDVADYPFITAEAVATSQTVQQAADGIIVKRDQWKILGAAIEKERLSGKYNIDQASTELEIEDAKDVAIAALGEL